MHMGLFIVERVDDEPEAMSGYPEFDEAYCKDHRIRLGCVAIAAPKPGRWSMSVAVADSAGSDLHLKTEAEIVKLIAETSRINEESRAFPWLPTVIAVWGTPA